MITSNWPCQEDPPFQVASAGSTGNLTPTDRQVCDGHPKRVKYLHAYRVGINSLHTDAIHPPNVTALENTDLLPINNSHKLQHGRLAGCDVAQTHREMTSMFNAHR